MTVTIKMILELTDEDFMGGRVGWSHATSFTLIICVSRFFSRGVLFSKIIRLSTMDGKYPRTQSEMRHEAPTIF